jgi:lipoteichoic acid synthase
MVERRQMMEHTMAKTGVNYYGIGLSLLFNSLEKVFHTERFHFTDEELQTINKYMYASSYPLPNDTVKNLIFILVESLSSYPINKSFGGVEITPNINKLLSTAYYNPDMESQALLGESSDGQFIYLTGLLPLKNGVTINEIKADSITTFVSLVKQQMPSLYSQMTIPTDKYSWSQEAMCKKYGIDVLFSKEDYTQKTEEDWLNDKQLFEFATENDHNLKPPFMNFILTSSMHSPYIKSYEEYNIDYPKDFSSELKHYLNNVHYMDKYLGKYIESLKKYPWYDQCTIIITADHKPNGPKLNVNNEELFTPLPLIIIHTSLNQQTVIPIDQSSLFPTLLDLYHIKTKWRGTGISIFTSDSILHSSHVQKKIYYKQKISDYIISNNYLQ